MRRRGLRLIAAADALTVLAALTVVLVGRGTPAAAGTPHYGGTLVMVGTGDVDYLDPNLTYYTVGYDAARMYSRQLLSYTGIADQGNTRVEADLAEQVPSRSNDLVSADGTRITVHIDPRARWNTNPMRSVNAEDAIRGILRTCNPWRPSGALPDFEDDIVGFHSFCTGFANVSPTVGAMGAYIQSHLRSIPGLQVGTDSQTIVFQLSRPAPYFVSELALPALSPAPVEDLRYLPGSFQLALHAPADGPYEVESWTPNVLLTFRRNPAWQSRSDHLRKGYVDRIVIHENVGPYDVLNEIQHGDAQMEWSVTLPKSRVPQMLARKDPNLGRVPTVASNPYLVFNVASPRNGGLMSKVDFRRALEYAIDRSAFIRRAIGNPTLSPPLSHVLPTGIDGSRQFDLYPYDPAKAKRLLRRAHAAHVTLRVVYAVSHPDNVRMIQFLQKALGAVGIRVQPVPETIAGEYGQFLTWPSAAHRGLWDLTWVGWGPDWYGDAALSFFEPLFGGRADYPPRGSDFGLYQSRALDRLIERARSETNPSVSQRLWYLADRKVMSDAAFFPISSPLDPLYYDASRLSGVAFVPAFDSADPTNVWFTK